MQGSRAKTGRKKAGRRPLPLERKPDSHKGQNGLVLVIGGSKDYVGAPALAGLAALRAGCDMVDIAAPEKAAWAINSLSPDLITVKLKGDYISRSHVKRLSALAKGFDAVLLGPGLAVKDRALVNSLVKAFVSAHVPLVIDADAVKAVDCKVLKNAVLTPHLEEFRSFLKANRKGPVYTAMTARDDTDSRIRVVREGLESFFSRGNVLLLKGRRDIVISHERAFISRGGNAGMTVGGTGDILAGLCAGYLAQTHDLFTSAGLASYNCKRIGDALLDRGNFGFGFIASDFLKEIKRMKKAGQKAGQKVKVGRVVR